MRISRLYCPDVSQAKQAVILSAQLSHYLVRVLRYRAGQKVKLFNNNDGYEYLAEVDKADNKACILIVIDRQKIDNESPVGTYLYPSLSKGAKLDTVIQKATELGISGVMPIISERVDVKMPQAKTAAKIEHWQKVAISAAEQSGRVFFPSVNPVRTLQNALETVKADVKILLSPFADQKLKALYPQFPDATSFAVFIGPEGGFAKQEVSLAKACGCQVILLGPRVLRTETAPLATVSMIQLLWGDA